MIIIDIKKDLKKIQQTFMTKKKNFQQTGGTEGELSQLHKEHL